MEHILVVGVEEDASVVEDQQALHIAVAADISGEADGVLPGQVTQEAKSTSQHLQELKGHLAEC